MCLWCCGHLYSQPACGEPYFQRVSETSRCPAAMEERTTRTVDLKTVRRIKGYHGGGVYSGPRLCWRSGLQAPDGLAIDWGEHGDTVAVAQHWFSASAVVESRWNESAAPEWAARLSSQISGSLFFFFFLALTFHESKRYIYLDISSAATLDRVLQQLLQLFLLLIWQYTCAIKNCCSAESITSTAVHLL